MPQSLWEWKTTPKLWHSEVTFHCYWLERRRLNCTAFGEDFGKCSIHSMIPGSTVEDMKELMCLYKRVVTCGIKNRNKKCKKFSYGVKDIAGRFTGVSFEDLRTKHFPNKCKVDGSYYGELQSKCSIADGRYCKTYEDGNERCTKGWNVTDDKLCSYAVKIVKSRWEYMLVKAKRPLMKR